MAVRPIVILGDPVLHTPAAPVPIAPDGSLPLWLDFPPDAPAGAVALLATLTTRVAGRFSDNAFALLRGAPAELCAGAAGPCAARLAASPGGAAPPTLSFIPWSDGPAAPPDAPALAQALLASLRVQHLGLYA